MPTSGNPRIMFRLDAAEYETAEQTAESLGMTIHDFCRTLLLAANAEVRESRTGTPLSGRIVRVSTAVTPGGAATPLQRLRRASRRLSGASQTQPTTMPRRYP